MTTWPDRSLLEVLREDLGVTGVKYGCGEGQCLACTVLMDDASVPACLTPVSDADKRSIVTIEGLAKGDKLHPAQEAFVAEGGFQCGYCTPGMILGTVALLKQTPHPSEAEIIAGMRRHICRCCNYPKIIKAVQRAAQASDKVTS